MGCSLPIITSNETITNLTEYELSQEETDLLKAGLYFSIQPDKIQKSEIFTTSKKSVLLLLITSNPRKPKASSCQNLPWHSLSNCQGFCCSLMCARNYC